MTTGRGVLERFGQLVERALPNTAVVYEDTPESKIPADQLVAPKSLTVLYIVDEDVTLLPFRQMQRDWVIRGYLYEPSEMSRQEVQDDLDAIRKEVDDDPYLEEGQVDKLVIRSDFSGSVVESHIDAHRKIGTFDYSAQWVTPGKAIVP